MLSAQIKKQATSYLKKRSLVRSALARSGAMSFHSSWTASDKYGCGHPENLMNAAQNSLSSGVGHKRGRPPKVKPVSVASSSSADVTETSSICKQSTQSNLECSTVVKMEDIDTELGSTDDDRGVEDESQILPSRKLKVVIKKATPPSASAEKKKKVRVNGADVVSNVKSYNQTRSPDNIGLVVKSEDLPRNMFLPVEAVASNDASENSLGTRRNLFDVMSDVNNNTSSSSECSSSDSSNRRNLPQFSCNVCGKKFLQKLLLDSHKRLSHRQKTRTAISCGVCRKQFANEHSYMSHLRAVHVTILNAQYFSCNVCDKRCRNLAFVIRQHMASHSQPLLTCSVCGRQFEDKCIYDAHMVVSHDVQSLS